ncbi:MAG: hypothetical protein AAGB29_07115 [Planctomycetota bacterium]
MKVGRRAIDREHRLMQGPGVRAALERLDAGPLEAGALAACVSGMSGNDNGDGDVRPRDVGDAWSLIYNLESRGWVGARTDTRERPPRRRYRLTWLGRRRLRKLRRKEETR